MASIDKPIGTTNRIFCSVSIMGTLQDRIGQAMATRGVGQAELARMLGITQPSVNALLHGNADRTKYILDISRALGVRPDWLQWGTGSMEGDVEGVPQPRIEGGLVELGGAEWSAVPRYDARLSAGAGAIVDPNAEPLGHMLFEAQWLRAVTAASPQHLAVVRVDGDSMHSTLNDGDWVLVDRTQRRLNREGIYALAVGDACWVKRITLNLRDRLIQVISDNPTYPLQELSEEDLTVLGRVVWIVGRRV